MVLLLFFGWELVARLTAGARVEEAFYEVAAASVARRSPMVPRGPALLSLAVAAVALFAVGLSLHSPEVAPDEVGEDVSVSCMAAPDVQQCEEEALGRGLMTGGGQIPRYDLDVCLTCGRDS